MASIEIKRRTRTKKPTPPHKEGTPYTPEEVAAILRVSAQVVTKLCRQGVIRALHIGTSGTRGLWRIEESALAEYRNGGASLRTEVDSFDPEPTPEAKAYALRHLKPARSQA